MSLSNTLKYATSVACLATCLGATGASAAEREFALVFKVLNNAFSPPIDAGCQAAARRNLAT